MEIKRPANLRSIALPVEHGGWGFLLEPILLGLILAPSLYGLLFGFAMLALFLVHQPLKVAVKDRIKGHHVPRTIWAEGFVLFYVSLAILLALPALLNGTKAFFVPIAAMLPFILIQTFYDFRNESRAMLPELSGAIALSASVAAIVILGGWELLPALMLYLVLVARAIPAILLVRSFFRKIRGKPASIPLTYSAHFTAIVLVAVIAFVRLLPWLSVVAMVILLWRAYAALNSPKAIAPKILGFREMGFGFMTVVLTVIGIFLSI
jgi:hypothetical protein